MLYTFLFARNSPSSLAAFSTTTTIPLGTDLGTMGGGFAQARAIDSSGVRRAFPAKPSGRIVRRPVLPSACRDDPCPAMKPPYPAGVRR